MSFKALQLLNTLALTNPSNPIIICTFMYFNTLAVNFYCHLLAFIKQVYGKVVTSVTELNCIKSLNQGGSFWLSA